jgi:hypothetical protein
LQMFTRLLMVALQALYLFRCMGRGVECHFEPCG